MSLTGRILATLFFLFTAFQNAGAQTNCASGSIQCFKCLPEKGSSADWKVGAIYLHGNIPFEGETGDYVTGEADNRKQLEAFAVKHKMRIAVPVSDEAGTYKGATYRVWDKTPLAKMEELAKRACPGVAVAEKAHLLGFSRAGAQVGRIAAEACNSGRYKNVHVIGMRDNSGGKASCLKHKGENFHSFPIAIKSLEDNLYESAPRRGAVRAGRR